jgi:hypothetical protein
VILLDKKEKELEDFQGKRVLATLGIIVSAIVVIVVVASALSSAPAKEPEEQAALYVDEVFFVLSGSNAATEKVTIDVTTFITNKGTADAKDVQIIAFVIDTDSNLGLDKSTFSVGEIPKEKTKASEFSLTMPNNESYNIRLIIQESGKIAIKGSGSVKLDQEYGGRGTRFSPDGGGNIGYDGDGDGDGDAASLFPAKEEEGFSSVALLLLFLLLAGCALIFYIVIRSRPKGSEKSYNSPHIVTEYNPYGMNQGTPPRFIIPNVQEAIPIEPEEEPQSEVEESESTEVNQE